MPFSPQEERLIAAVIKQMDPSVFPIDFQKVAEEMGISGGKDDAKAAEKRWSRLKKKVKNTGGKETMTAPKEKVKDSSVAKKRKIVHNENTKLQSPPIMSADAEKQKLMASILSQVNIGHIDWDKVAKDLNTPTANAARVRWQRFRKTLPSFDNGPNRDGSHGTASPPVTPKKRQSPTKRKSFNRSPAKKQKRSRPRSNSDEENDELEPDIYYKEENNYVLPEIPARSLPSRKAKVKSPIKEAVTSDEEEEEDVTKVDMKCEDLIEDRIDGTETQETQGTVESGRAFVDSGSDFDGNVEG
ncbi:hypothetical protein EYC80_000603 [Monilinia laxa]|uniref:Myb-like DNA-binding domain-containing protein n=1 Tax=Monilinia laxa TaxID=61186 RepID=A0A5N6KB55_MONLA|nr:hypothetical protein EYC80_000603 [Monilinia laxa]